VGDPACSAACGCGYVGGKLAAAPPPAPIVLSVLPVAGPAAGGQHVTVKGHWFTPTAAIAIGGVAAALVTYVDDDTIIVSTGPHVAAAGVSVDVTTTAGTNAPNALYSYV
jgi:hypothetical protein